MIEQVTVAPLVLLSVVDHYNRVAKDSKRRVVGVILGNVRDGTARVANSFAVPFEEDQKNSDVWFLDHNYIENMQRMFSKVNANEKLIGWYHSGPKLRANDLKINELFKRYTPQPLLLIVDVVPKEVGIPTDAYTAIDEVKADGTTSGRTFVHIPNEIKAEDAEEIGVEQLLRDVHNTAAGNLSVRITNQLQSLQGLGGRLGDVAAYLDRVLEGDLPVNHDILGLLQDVFNLLPNLNVGPQHPELGKAFTANTNDHLMIVYLGSVVRAILSFHDMIDNKIQNKRRTTERLERLEQARSGEQRAKTDEQ